MEDKEVDEAFVLHVADADARLRIRESFADLEQRLGIDGLGDVLSSATMELIENAVKANLKRAFFLRHRLNLEERDSYAEGVRQFIRSYGKIKGEQYVSALRELDLVVTLAVNQTRDRLLVQVANNTILLATEEERIRHQLARAMQADEFIEFYLNYGDETEGSGLGLAMIVFLMRNIGFDPEHFRIFHSGGRTTARLEFPLSSQYVPLRERWKRETSA